MAESNHPLSRCRQCGRRTLQPMTGRRRSYCSPACRQKAYRRRHGGGDRELQQVKAEWAKREALPLTERDLDPRFYGEIWVMGDGRRVYLCAACGKQFVRKARKNGAPVSPYCSDACARRAKTATRAYYTARERAHQRGELSEAVEQREGEGKISPLCPVCGNPFAPTYGKPGTPRKYCSDRCRRRAYERRWKRARGRCRVHRYRICPNCGEKFDRTDGQGRRIKLYCSARCMKNMTARERARRAKAQAARRAAERLRRMKQKRREMEKTLNALQRQIKRKAKRAAKRTEEQTRLTFGIVEWD